MYRHTEKDREDVLHLEIREFIKRNNLKAESLDVLIIQKEMPEKTLSQAKILMDFYDYHVENKTEKVKFGYEHHLFDFIAFNNRNQKGFYKKWIFKINEEDLTFSFLNKEMKMVLLATPLYNSELFISLDLYSTETQELIDGSLYKVLTADIDFTPTHCLATDWSIYYNAVINVINKIEYAYFSLP